MTAEQTGSPIRDPFLMEDPYDKDVRARKRRWKLPLIVAICVAVVAVAGFFVWQSVRPADISAYAQEEIEMVGIGSEPIMVTVQELADMDCVSMTLSGEGKGENGESKAGIVEANGPTLETFLAQYDLKPTDFGRIGVYCNDGYTTYLNSSALENEVILSIAQGKDPLEEKRRPLRIIVPEGETGSWAYGVTKLEFMEKPEAGTTVEEVLGAEESIQEAGAGAAAAYQEGDE